MATGPLTSEGLAEAFGSADRRRRALPFSMRLHRSSTVTASICPLPGSSRATTRAETAVTTSIARSTSEQYERFVERLLAAEQGQFREWENDTPYFEGCLPIEVMAQRGRETLGYGPMKPVGLANRTPGGDALRRRSAPPGQRVRHPLQHRRLPDQAEAMPSRCGSSAPFLAWRMRSSPASAACTATPSSTARSYWMRRCG